MTRKCSVCNCTTTGVPTFRVTKDRLESWGVVIGKTLKIGDRLCQTHFSEESVKTEDIMDITNRTSDLKDKFFSTLLYL